MLMLCQVLPQRLYYKVHQVEIVVSIDIRPKVVNIRAAAF